MEFEKDVDLPEHAHADQVGIVLEGKIGWCKNNCVKFKIY